MRQPSHLILVIFLAICSRIDGNACCTAKEESGNQAGPHPQFVWDANATAINFAPDSKVFAVATEDLRIRVYELATSKQLFTLNGHTVPISALAISPDGKLLASAGFSETKPTSFELRMWSLGNGELLHQVQEKGHRSEGDTISPMAFLAFSPDNMVLAFPGKDRSVQLCDTKSWEIRQSWKLGLVPSTAAFSPEGKTIAIGTHTGKDHGTVSLFDVRTGKQTRTHAAVYSGVMALAFPPDEKAIWGAHRHSLNRLDVPSDNYEQVWTWEGRQQADAVSFMSDGDRVALVIDDNLELRETKSGRTLLRLNESSRLVALAPDGQAIASASKDGKVKLWRIDDLPDIGKLLEEACDLIASHEEGLGKAYLYRQAAVLYGRSGDLESAYKTLDQIFPRSYGQTAKNLKRVGFLEMVEDVALHENAELAIKIIDDCPSSYREYSDDAFGRVAVSAAKRGDAKVAWSAIERIKKPDGLYPYELVAAITLDDKKRGREILSEWRDKPAAADAKTTPSPPADLSGIVWTLSLYKWCGMEKEMEELLDQVSGSTDSPDKTRAEIMRQLKEASTEHSNEANEVEATKQVSSAEIRSLYAKVKSAPASTTKVDRLLSIAKSVLDFGRPTTRLNCN